MAVQARGALLAEGTARRAALGHGCDRELLIGTLHSRDVQTGEMRKKAGKLHGTLLVEQSNAGGSALLFYQVAAGGGAGVSLIKMAEGPAFNLYEHAGETT
jgi:hypothetical protein